MTIDRYEARCERAHQLLAEAGALLLRLGDEADSSSSKSSTSYSGTGSPISIPASETAPLQAALDQFETALVLAPHLRPSAVSLRGSAAPACVRAGRVACPPIVRPDGRGRAHHPNLPSHTLNLH